MKPISCILNARLGDYLEDNKLAGRRTEWVSERAWISMYQPSILSNQHYRKQEDAWAKTPMPVLSNLAKLLTLSKATEKCYGTITS